MHLLAVPFSKSIHVPFLARLDQPLHLRLEIAAVGFPVGTNMPTFDVIPSLAKWNPVLLHMLRQRWEFLFDPLQEIEASFLEALVATKLSSEATHFRIKESHGLEGLDFFLLLLFSLHLFGLNFLQFFLRRQRGRLSFLALLRQVSQTLHRSADLGISLRPFIRKPLHGRIHFCGIQLAFTQLSFRKRFGVLQLPPYWVAHGR